MMQCSRCKSFGINPHLHGREVGVDLDLCDVCYWRKRAEGTESILEIAEKGLERAAQQLEQLRVACTECHGTGRVLEDHDGRAGYRRCTCGAARK